MYNWLKCETLTTPAILKNELPRRKQRGINTFQAISTRQAAGNQVHRDSKITIVMFKIYQ